MYKYFIYIYNLALLPPPCHLNEEHLTMKLVTPVAIAPPPPSLLLLILNSGHIIMPLQILPVGNEKSKPFVCYTN